VSHNTGPQTIVCMKWGDRYPASYVNCLWAMIRRNTTRRTKLVCYTDNPVGIDPDVTTLPLPTLQVPARASNSPWRKLAVWAADLQGVSGDVLFIDLDVVITGDLDALFDYKPEATFCVIENWTQMGSGIGNTSCFRFRVGAHPYIYDGMCRDPDAVVDAHRNEQIYISRTITDKAFWPATWCVSFKHNLLPRWPLNFFRSARLPAETKVVCFTGKPDPDEARDGRWPAPWHKRIYKYVRPTPWIAEHWRPA
jgi:hypothetical protein